MCLLYFLSYTFSSPCSKQLESHSKLTSLLVLKMYTIYYILVITLAFSIGIDNSRYFQLSHVLLCMPVLLQCPIVELISMQWQTT